MKVKEIPIPENSLIRRSFNPTDYEDNFAIQLHGPVDLDRLPVLFFKSFPSWFRGLMLLREVLARPFGLKTAHGMDIIKQMREFKGKVGESIAVFQVMGKNETELMMGEDDKHLNFRLSFFTIPNERGTEVQMATTVKYTSWMGDAYFFLVRPIHRIAMPILLRRMQERINQNFNQKSLSAL